MSEVATQPASDSPAPGSDPAATGGEGTPAQTPEGFVPLSEAETLREEGRRARQAAEDLRQELARAKAQPKPASTTDASEGFDPQGFRESILKDVLGAVNLTNQASTMKTEFPNADPALFDPERMAQFTSPEAYRSAVKDSHQRVAAILESGRAEMETRLREELAAKFGDGGAATGSAPSVGGDPTPERLAAMSVDELNALPAGTIERVMAGLR